MIADAGMGGLLTELEYKCPWYGADFMKADPWFASSRLCAHCGWKNEDMNLCDREWRYGGCGEFRELAGFELPGDRTWRPCKTGCAGGGR